MILKINWRNTLISYKIKNGEILISKRQLLLAIKKEIVCKEGEAFVRKIIRNNFSDTNIIQLNKKNLTQYIKLFIKIREDDAQLPNFEPWVYIIAFFGYFKKISVESVHNLSTASELAKKVMKILTEKNDGN